MMFVYGIVINFIVLSILSFFDIKYKIAPNYVTVPYIVFGILGVIFGFSSDDWFLNLVELVVFLVVISFYSILKKKKLFEVFGGGDIKTLMGFSFFCSFEIFNLSIILGSILGIVWGVLNKREGVKFIPFILLGYVLGNIIFYFFGFPLDIFGVLT